MASHKSAEKCIRQTARRTLVNQNRMSRIRTFVKKIETLLENKASKVEASSALVQAERELMRGVTKGLLHKNTVARKVSRLAKKVKTLA
jgi:small subunit ribosomal protein S20